MFPSQLNDTIPLQLSAAGKNDVSNVGSVEAFATGDKQLGHQQFFWSQHSGIDPEDDRGASALGPGSVHGDYSVAHAGDEIDKIAVAMCLGQPDGIADFALEAMLGKAGQGIRRVLR